MGTKVRILAAVLGYQPNQVVDLPVALAKSLAASGEVDAHKDAVAYCINDLGAKVIVHKAAPALEEQQLQAEITQLEAALAEAEEADKPALQAALDEKKAVLG